MKVSIIVPVYNSAQYLPTCLGSLMDQTLPDWEALLVDDGSTDHSRELCQEYCSRDSRFRLLCLGHKGVSAARNLAMGAATGDFFFFLDSDDAIHPSLLMELVKQAEASKSDITYCASAWLEGDAVEKYLSQRKQDVLGGWKIFDKEKSEDYYQNQRPLELMDLHGKLFRRGGIDSRRFDETISHGEDTLFLYHVICRQPRMARCEREWYYYRRREGSLTGEISLEECGQSIKAYELIQGGESARGRPDRAARWREAKMMVLTDRIFLAREAGRKDVARELRGWLLEERRHPLYRGRSFTCKTAVFLCLYGYPLFHLVKLAIRWLRKAARRLECR